MSATPRAAAEALRLLQQGHAQAALELAREICAAQPRNARAYLAAGLALRVLGRLDESRSALENAAGLDPADYGAAFELGNAHELQDHAEEAMAHYARAVSLRPTFLPARHALAFTLHRAGRPAEAEPHFAAAAAQPMEVRWLLDHAKALADLGRHDEARAVYARAVAMAPADPGAHVARGRFSVARGDLATAAQDFAQAWRLDPESIEWPMYLAQVELLRGRWAEGWAGYRWREQRVRFEAAGARAGSPYLVPKRESLPGCELTLVREQGLGDELFFLRMAPALHASGVRLSYVGDARLLPLLARARLFETLRDIEREPPRPGERVLLTADLPLVVDALFAPTLAIAPREDVLERMRARLQAAGPRPWIGLTWRSGTPRALDAEALSKEVSLEVLAAAVGPLPGTLFALQRGATPAELARLASLMARPVHSLQEPAEDLEESLALTTLLDRHVAVSSTNMHLAAGAGATADVLVPYPPEWLWRMEGDSPWFPGFRIHRQDRDGRWDIRL